jgi:hypothetical protein
MIQDRRLQINIEGGKHLASKIVELVQNRDDDFGTAISGMAIAYATLCVAEGVKLHDCMELVLTIYKNTKVIDEDGNDVELS